ncbi:MAG: hypothetical protein KGJ75_01205 [Alphaproteobacteria bacterium]|nr:hypothetical protein [Alphaproteobacteria bacterium]
MAEEQAKGFLPLALQPDEGSAAKPAFDARWKRLMDCVEGRTPDRLPVALYATFWLAKYGGISCKELMYNHEKTKELAERATLELDPDITTGGMVAACIYGPSLDAMDFKQLQWPGHGIGDNQPYQYLDREYMLGDEYDEFLFDPTAFYLRKYLPRIGGVFEGLQEMPYMPGMHYFRLIAGLRGFANPKVRQAFENLFKVAEEVDRMAGHNAEFAQRITALGYPRDVGGNTVSPYDFVADYFRGARGMMTDLFRKKDKLLALLDKARIFLTKLTIDNARAAGHPIVMIPIHWAPDAFMSDKQFKEFYWPPFRQMLLDMIDAGIVPMPLWEADCTKRLEIIADIPKNKAIYWFERTDMVKAFEVLGDTVCLRGNLSPSMLTTGTPDDVDKAVRHLVENVFNKGGRLLLDAAFGLPDETPVENARAMFAAARKYAG